MVAERASGWQRHVFGGKPRQMGPCTWDKWTYLPGKQIRLFFVRGLSWLMVGLALVAGGSSIAEARDVRFALLVGNQHGWKGDPTLRYALPGDIRPLASMLRRIGFVVRVLEDQGPETLRQTFRDLRGQLKRAKTSTFLFYYSGHADRKYFHLGPEKSQPFSYREFVSFLRELPVQRRIAMVDACFSGEIVRQFGSLQAYKKLIHKGIRSIRPIDLSKNFPNQGHSQGIQLITSSLEMSWESQKHRASVFTHYLLEGLRGLADQDRDGKISVNELFNFVSQSMFKEVKQKPILFGVIKRTGAYALAPAYHSRLWIGPKVIGNIRVSVDNFYWSRHKAQRRPIRLAVISGSGTVELESNGACWKQKIDIPKGREARVLPTWEKAVCFQEKRFRKGMIEFPSQLHRINYAKRSWSLEVEGGLLLTPLAGGSWLGGGRFGLRRRYWGLGLGLWGATVAFQQSQQQQFFLDLTAEGGWRQNWGRWDLFVGGFVGMGLLLQDLNSNPRTGAVFRAGVKALPSVWLTQRWGLVLELNAGLALGQLGGQLRPIPLLHALLGVRIRL